MTPGQRQLKTVKRILSEHWPDEEYDSGTIAIDIWKALREEHDLGHVLGFHECLRIWSPTHAENDNNDVQAL